jgi:uncharacterized protein
MPRPPTRLTDEIGIALANLAEATTGALTPTLRLGVTGLSRAGKTIFITALVQALLSNARLPAFAAATEGRLLGARLAEYPDASIPRFAFEQHLAALTGAEPHWPDSTRRISQLRLTVKYQSRSWLKLARGTSTLNLDIVDYPGEWLLDLPLLDMSYAEWSAIAIGRARAATAVPEADAFLALAANLDRNASATDTPAESLAAAFTTYLRASRADRHALSALPPGRFLLPGDLEGSPALTFAPLPDAATAPRSGSLDAMLARRFEAYKDVVIRPFLRDHFLRLDRQIVLVDPLRALNAGPAAVTDLEQALTGVLTAFRHGESNPVSRLVSRRIDRILFAATKADHVHSSSHDRLEALLNRLLLSAARQARFAGARTSSLALAAVRATREGTVDQGAEKLNVVIGTPEAGERLGDVVYDGRSEIALFPGDLPENPDSVLERADPVHLNFLRFNPPRVVERTADGDPVLPNIRLDRALEFLLGDWLK